MNSPLTNYIINFLLGCGNATLVSALNSDDSGTDNILNGIYSLPLDIVMAAFGNLIPGSAAYDFLSAYNIS